FSHYGIPITVFALSMPLAIWAFRRHGGENGRSPERALTSIAFLLTFVLLVPVKLRPLGLFAGFPRYLVFITLPFIAWRVAGAVRAVGGVGARAAAGVAVLGTSALFVAHAVDYGKHDRFAPLDYVKRMQKTPGSRTIHFIPNRAASVADRLAAPTDTIAI